MTPTGLSGYALIPTPSSVLGVNGLVMPDFEEDWSTGRFVRQFSCRMVTYMLLTVPELSQFKITFSKTPSVVARRVLYLFPILLPLNSK
jgi:hypothetical protein